MSLFDRLPYNEIPRPSNTAAQIGRLEREVDMLKRIVDALFDRLSDVCTGNEDCRNDMGCRSYCNTSSMRHLRKQFEEE